MSWNYTIGHIQRSIKLFCVDLQVYITWQIEKPVLNNINNLGLILLALLANDCKCWHFCWQLVGTFGVAKINFGSITLLLLI
jgi:hypothetical protein